MSDAFRTVPTLKELAVQIAKVHNEVRVLANGCGETIANMEHNIRQNNGLTDSVLEELTLQVGFLMNMLAVRTPANSGIAGPDGKVAVETKKAAQVYQEQRPALIAARKALQERMQGAEGLPSTEAPEGAPTDLNGETRHDLIGDGDDASPGETKH